jgi:radical SAM protein with 4Fe4S-binding SPASM domain
MTSPRRKYRVQEPPFNVSFELTLGCNLRCPMCAVGVVHDKPGRDYKFMELRTITRVVEQIRDLKWNCRIGFAMRGEPSLHPQRAEMMAEVRKYLPKAHITMLTNGGGLLGGPGPVANVNALFDAGLNVLGMDHYTNIKFVPKILEAFCEEHKPKRNKKPLPELISGDHYGQFQFFRYPQDRRGNPHVRRPRNSRTLIQIRDIMEQDKDNKTGTHSKVFNYGGLSFPPDDSMDGKRCHHPFRPMVVQWDGNVPGCCNDWRSAYNVANVHERTLEQIWQSDEFGAMREKLYHGQRDFVPCKGCNHRSYRVGLLPDLLGKGKLRKPDEQTARDIAKVVKRGDHTPMINPPEWALPK